MTKPIFNITGRVQEERGFALSELLDMDTFEVGDLLLACGSGDIKDRVGKFFGVLLTDIINRAEVITTEHNDTKKMFVVVSSVDGYRTVFSWQELFNSSVGEGVMVILEKEGKRVYEDHGGVDLISSNDFLSGPRYVKQLSNIQIIMFE